MKHTPFQHNFNQKKMIFLQQLIELNHHHYQNCNAYKNIVNSLFSGSLQAESIEELPYLPVQIFKNLDLRSVHESSITNTMTSSGTTGNSVSKIYIDKRTSFKQSSALSEIVTDFIGKEKIPMLIVDCEKTISDRNFFSARTAAILGFSRFASKKIFLLNDDLSINDQAIQYLMNQDTKFKFFFFGFTFIIWEFLIQALKLKGVKLNLENAICIHGGGWKMLEDQNISNDAFKSEFHEVLGVRTVFNYYGMIEQTGSIYFECEHGHLHCSDYSDIIIRDLFDFRPLNMGEEGLIQTCSSIPFSYPGHSILTEDIGTLLGVDDCSCGRLGKYFKVQGRVPRAEIRGCSDTFRPS